MKKRTLIYPIVAVLAGTAVALTYFLHPISAPVSETNNLWFSKRTLPKNIAVNAYLAANVARANQDLDKAVLAYADVLEKDPENTSLLEETYLLAMIQGQPEAVLPHLKHLKNNKMLADYTRSVSLFKDGKTSEAFTALKQTPLKGGNALLLPLVRTWFYADQNNLTEALREVYTLTETPFIKGYQKVLL